MWRRLLSVQLSAIEGEFAICDCGAPLEEKRTICSWWERRRARKQPRQIQGAADIVHGQDSCDAAVVGGFGCGKLRLLDFSDWRGTCSTPVVAVPGTL